MFDEPVSRRAKIIGGIGLTAIVIGFMVSLVLLLVKRGPLSPADVEAMFERSPPDREATESLKANFPADYQRLLERVAEVSRTDGREAAILETGAFMRRFIGSKANAITAAPVRELQRIGGGQLALIRVLRDENVGLCAQYAISEPPPGTRMPASALPVLAHLSVYVIEAARAGEQPGRTRRTTLSEADSRAWLAAMRAIDPATTHLIETDTVTRQPPEAQCRAGVVVYEAVTHLPAATAANVTAFLVRESISGSPAER
jgi:hypothetical protein